MNTSTTSTTGLDPVLAWLRSYTGTDSFLLSIKAADARYGLTDRQYEAAKKNMERALAPKPAGVPVEGLDLSSLPKGTTYHAARNAEGKLNFLRIDNVESGSWAGWVFVKQVIGGNPDERRGSQKPGTAYRGTMQYELKDIVAQPNSTMSEYGRELGYCARCNRHLTDATSRELGIGPECRKKGM